MRNAIFYSFAFLLPLLWHYADYLKKDFNIYAIFSAIGFIGTFVLYYAFFIQRFKRKTATKSKKKDWISQLKQKGIPVILTIVVMVVCMAALDLLDRGIIKGLGEERQQVVVTKDPSISTVSRENRIVGHYFYYYHQNKRYSGEALIEDFRPGDSLLVVYSTIFPAIRLIETFD